MKSKLFLMVPKPTPLFLPVILMLTLVLFALSGCGATPVAEDDFKPFDVTFNIKVPYQCGQPPAVSVVRMRDINWEVINVENLVLDEGGEPFTGQLVTLTVDDYKALGANTSDWIAASAESRDQRFFYRDCIARSQKEAKEDNDNVRMVQELDSEADAN